MHAPLDAVHAGATGQAAQQQPVAEIELKMVEAAVAAQRQCRLGRIATLQGKLWRRSQERAKLRQLEGRLKGAESRITSAQAHSQELAAQAEALTAQLAAGEQVRGLFDMLSCSQRQHLVLMTACSAGAAGVGCSGRCAGACVGGTVREATAAGRGLRAGLGELQGVDGAAGGSSQTAGVSTDRGRRCTHC